ncbi:MAG: ParB/RepB/Spo0J family partition protein, partial [Bacteroidales bacterium]|nr:ParB/RepB/Spo0J family partition protein [Bacteroidales bacterium]
PVSPLTSIKELELSAIVPNPYQPRSAFDEAKLQELSESIKQMGVIQPITVKKISVGRYQIISGERRFRASKLAGLKSIPVYVKDAEEVALLEMALVENIQREDLDPVDIAISFQRLIEECNLTQEQLSPRVGKNRATIANYLRLLKLPPEIQMALKEGKITMGHAKAILSLTKEKSQLALTKKIIEEGISVREAEKIAQKGDVPKAPAPKKVATGSESAQKIVSILGRYFKDQIKIKPKEKGGEMVIRYKDEKQLENFLKAIKEHNL